MRVVNLSRRPFTNRQPVHRLATLLWIVGGILLLVNVWLYAGHFSGSSKGQGRLEALGRQVAQEEAQLQELWQELQSLNLDERNRRVRYLNSLIHSRTFPWSALFDDLEDALPIDVYLASVRPSLRLADEPKTTVASRPRRATTAREARARARGETTETRPAVEEEAEKEDLYSGDRVSLTLQAFARNDEAMFELVDRLYQDPSFLNPDLSRESKGKSGKINFSIKVTYLTPKKGAAPPEEGTVEAELATRDAEQERAADGSPRSRPRAVEVGEGEGASSVPVTRVTGEGPGSQEPEGRSVASRGSRSFGPSDSRTRDVRRGRPQNLEGLPPEEGEETAVAAESSGEAPGRRGRSSSRPSLRGPSTVSVAPGVVGGVPTAVQPAGTGAPGGDVGRPGQDSGGSADRGGTTTTRPAPGSRPESAGSGAPEPDGSNPDVSDPGPTRPPASSSPRLQGSLFDRWIPDFLRSLPAVPGYPELDEEVIG